ncbi:FAD-dependent oxidoreductase [Streptomyces thermoviolaceus]|uniref:ferredoxin--NADP(+) reductase n=1 Tax=Streptomyces thermoviolaceus subsp. thermoviolaceus TaxID=66860 RepID=A0ABX0YQQ1_STRTL|nr:FAD-dependent oxidoreductase [Streptomyces thermoviolaceus]NJP14907.1 FAD-dependent oxidoreductase [Streptomyces thermoviolaceus subsp. thermoviolaceus]GGV64089.1 NADP oxidoreductase [Streptomyces thermoviolaceus subsp. apingens]GHA99009.1 NADP oxidoreductase [Streptomyces thermoviolaceus subsp. thermoviolaceus]
MLRVAVVGSGPSGCYTAQSLVQQDSSVRVDVLDRLPCPYGLVRYGVAPDHEKIKSLQNSLRTVLEHERVRFLGCVQVGGPGRLPVGRLRELYHAVVYCVGAAADRRLGIPGEDLPGSWSATEFVSWYSAHPDAVDAGYLRGVRSAVVVGVGNVAVDVARMLARRPEELTVTDMPEAALAALAAGTVREIHMVGRRGPSQARFTTKELRELGSLPGAEVVVDPEELALDPAYTDPSGLPAAQRRNVEVLHGWADAAPRDAERRVRLRFFLRPVEVLEQGGRVAGVRFERTVPDGQGGIAGTGRYEDVAAQLLLRSVGYRGVPLDGLPFDAVTGTVPHTEGRVLRDGTVAPGEYVAGWIKRGPTGVIGTNRPCAKETVTSLLADAPVLVRDRVVPEDAVAVLRADGVEPVEWEGWQAIERAEARLGASLGRGVVKLPDWESLRAAAAGREV